ncbi:hypothetical protein RND71_034271 [Anisodus tanguticus]|uniref:peptide-methionine (S)-S-oxide reductase n=1 Tax=Anisodus tanguticus TaxID=243964 RepID=A0AAE1UY83_9SOLA|nr:hypothetical protein RND71_034271 [Anisodus tanguticus]
MKPVLCCNSIYRFHDVEAAYGRVGGVVRTATGYCGGTIRKPSYKEVSEGTTGHTEAVKITYDKRNFGLSTHLRSAIFCSTEEERKQAQKSKIRRQMKLNRRILTKIAPFLKEINCHFFLAENQYQKHYRLCESLSLRSTEQFVESYIACKLKGYVHVLTKSHDELLIPFKFCLS